MSSTIPANVVTEILRVKGSISALSLDRKVLKGSVDFDVSVLFMV